MKRIVNKKGLAVARKYRELYFKAKKATQRLDEVRSQFIKVCPENNQILGVYHLIRENKVPNEATLKYFKYWGAVTKTSVDIGLLNQLIDTLCKQGKAGNARQLYKISEVHEVGIKKS
jgi:hypothetical protein